MRVIGTVSAPVKDFVKVRLLGIDAPEIGSCYADEAKQRLEEMLVSSTFITQKDEEPMDDNERLLRHVFVTNDDPKDGMRNVSEELLRGGKKPWRQKGTGRARTSSIRNPIWRGGGTIFGPTGEQNHTINLPKKAIRSSIAQALSLKAEAKAIHVIEAFDCKEGKIRATADLLKKMELTGKTLIVVDKWDGLVERATGNLANVSASEPRFLTVNMVLDAKSIVITTAALEQLKAWLGTTGAKA
jgi:large subunit ribosomal protein L4